MEYIILFMGLFLLYSIGHFFVLQFYKTWEDRTGYEKFITITSIIILIITVLGLGK